MTGQPYVLQLLSFMYEYFNRHFKAPEHPGLIILEKHDSRNRRESMSFMMTGKAEFFAC